jgi:hypothetical protein
MISDNVASTNISMGTGAKPDPIQLLGKPQQTPDDKDIQVLIK